MVERRRSGRAKVSLKAQRISGGARRGVLIENISESGIKVLTDPKHKMAALIPGDKVDIGLELPSGEEVNIRCRVRWAHSNVPTGDMTSSVGMEVINPPAKYIKFVRDIE